MVRVGLVALLATSAIAAERTPLPSPDGMPFGRIVEEDVDHLQEFAIKRAGVDLKAEITQAYGKRTVDEDALARVFAFSRQFNTFDNYARTYGQIIYTNLLKLGEEIGVPAYARIIDRQPADVRQRIRDFLFYPYTRQVPKEHWKESLEETRRTYPGLFPNGFQFGRNDPIFSG